MNYYTFRWHPDEGEESHVCALSGAFIEDGDEVVAYAEDSKYRDDNMYYEEPEHSDVEEWYLSDVFEEEFSCCGNCGHYYRRDDMTWVESEDEYICEDCLDEEFSCCDHCNNWFRTDDMESDDYTVVCSRCFSNYYRCCEDCACIIRDVYVTWVGDYPYCEECAPDENVHSYSYKPDPVFHRIGYHGFRPSIDGERQPLYLGVELEVDNGNDESCVSSKFDEDDVYCKEDGSLGSYGFEIVSHPRTLESHKEYDWGEIMDKCLHYEYRSHNTSTCGLHIHVNRDFFGTYTDSDLAAAKLILLMARFWDGFFVPFSRRSSDALSEWAEKPLSTDTPEKGDTIETIQEKVRNAARNRYKAVNVRNRDTIEFRLFRGTLRYETFIATLELVDGLCNWVNNHTLDEALDATLEDILNSEEFKEFDTMRAYIKGRNLEIANGEDDVYDEEEC
ncbi:MAG: amidoligase family protein [Oscillospiraceae bacterium]